MNNKQYQLIGESIWDTYYEIGLILEAKKRGTGTFFAHQGVGALETLGAEMRAGTGKGRKFRERLRRAMQTLQQGGEDMQAAKKPIVIKPRTREEGTFRGPWPPRKSGPGLSAVPGKSPVDPDTGEPVEDISRDAERARDREARRR